MADSNIVCSGLTATGGTGQITWEWQAADPTDFKNLAYMQLDKFELWVSATNDRSAALKIAEPTANAYPQTGLAASTTRYGWVRAKDRSGNLGDWFPLSSTGGISATTGTGIPSVPDLSTISPDLGTITAGLVTGARIRTAASGARVEATVTDNSLKFYNRSGVLMGEISFDRSSSQSMFKFDLEDGGIDGAFFRNDPGVAIFGRNNASYASILGENYNNSGRAGAFHNLHSSNLGGQIRLGNSAGGGLGGWAAYAIRNGYGPFTGAHDALIAKGTDITVGDLVADFKVIARNGISDTLTEVVASSSVAQRGVVGIVVNRNELGEDMEMAALRPSRSGDRNTPLYRILMRRYDHMVINALGEGQLNVCGRGGDLERGDLICASDMRGKGQRQNDSNGNPDDLLRRCTVAWVRESIAFDHPDQVKRVACIYLCG